MAAAAWAAGDGPVLEINGGFSVNGAVSVDGQGRLEVGSNADPNVQYNANVFNALESYGTAGLVQNTWRELAPGSRPGRSRSRLGHGCR